MITLTSSYHRSGTKTNDALRKLFALGGIATMLEWRAALKWRETIRAFDQDVIFVLVQHELIYRRRENWHITDLGKQAIGIDPLATCGAGDLVPAPVIPILSAAPLSRPSLSKSIPFRPGSMDYRDIPSRHGDQSIPHRKA